ncbi:MAG: DUF2877 domain-containing protein [Dorea sp.]|nr:DUF2877 domain-containing protein [Dorea sp.]
MSRQSVSLLITDTATYAVQRLKSYSAFRVHSIYRKTINLHAAGKLLAIQAQGSPLSPVSLITNLSQAQMEQLPVFEDQAVYITKTHLIFCKDSEKPAPLFAFSYQDAQVHDLALPGIYKDASSGFLSPFKDLLYSILSQAGTNGMDLVFSSSPLLSGNWMMSAAKVRIDDSVTLMKKQLWEDAASELIRLIGLGIGLTPSGDDFTTGVLAGMILFGLKEHPFFHAYREQVLAHLSDTNDVSRTFLTAAIDGHFSTAINSLTRVKKEDLGENFSQTENCVLEKFLAIGHSSGIDALCGIYFVLCHLL